MEIIKLPSAVVKDRKKIRQKNQKRNRNAYNELKNDGHIRTSTCEIQKILS